MNKPPLGVSPHWYVYNARMQELCESIKNHLEYIKVHHCIENSAQRYEVISQYAEELKTLASLEARLEGKKL